MAGLDFRTDANGFRKAPKGKLPYIDDDGDHRRRFDLHPLAYREEVRHRFRPRPVGRAARDRLGVREDGGGASLLGRWSMRAGCDDANFAQGAAQRSSSKVPAAAAAAGGRDDPPQGPQALHAPGLRTPFAATRSSALGTRSIDAIADYLGQQAVLHGQRSRPASTRPCSLSSPARCARASTRRCAPPPSGTTISGATSAG